MARLLWKLREGKDITGELWDAFKERATTSGCSPTAALARLMRRFLAHGFDDGAPERSETDR